MTTTASPAPSISDAALETVDAWWRAANYLSVGQIYLLDNPLLHEPLTLDHVKPRLLGHWGTTPGLNLIYAHLNRVIRARDADVLYVCGPGHGGPGMVANTWLEGTYSEVYPEIGQDEDGHRPPVPPVLVPGRHPQPRRSRDPRVDQRGRRAGLRARPCLRRRLRQPRPGGGVRGRRRRGRDRTARRGLALEQVPQPGHRRRRAADPAPQRVQDRQPHRARPHPRGRAGPPARGLRPPRPRGGGRRAGRGPPGPGRRAGRRVRRDRPDPSGVAVGREAADRASPVADDRAAHAQGLDRPVGRRRRAGRGHVPVPPGATGGAGRQPRAPAPPRGVDAQLPPRRAVRRRAAGTRDRRPVAGRRQADGRHPVRQRRAAAHRPRPRRLPRRSGRRARTGAHVVRAHARAGPLAAGRGRAQPDDVPHHGARRDGVEPPDRRVRGDRPRVDGRQSSPATTTSHRRGG